LKLTDYKVLTNNQKTQGFWDRWKWGWWNCNSSTKQVNQLVLKEMKHYSITQHKVTNHINFYSTKWSCKVSEPP